MATIIREATTSDVNEFASLFDAYRIDHGCESAVEACATFLSQRLSANESRALLAFSGNSCLAFAHLYPRFASLKLTRNWILNDLYVRAEDRRKGLARSLVQASKTLASEAGADTLSVTTTADNRAAKALYFSTGFQAVDGIEVLGLPLE